MIYRRSGENCENGVRYRLAACRKRLRLIRATHRVKLLQLDETLRGIAISSAGAMVPYTAVSPANSSRRREQGACCERLL